MASFTNPTIHATGDVLSVTDWNAVANNTTFLWQAPYFSYFNSVAVSLPSSTITQVTLGGTTFSGYGFSVSGNNAIAPLPGIYFLSGAVSVSSTTGFIQVLILQNGGTVLEAISNATSTSTVTIPVTAGLVKCSASDTLGLYVQQNQGNTIATNTGAATTYINGFLVGSQ